MKPKTVPFNKIPAVAKKIASQLQGGEILALIGELGSGKTTFTQALAKALKVRAVVSSPTFIIMNQYTINLAYGKKLQLYHLDLYRTKNFAEVKALGITELWKKPNNVTIIEWADKIKKYLPKKTLYFYFHNL